MNKLTIVTAFILICLSNCIPLPTADLLKYQDAEIGGMVTFNMASMTPNCTQNGYCVGVGGCLGWLPPVDTFNPILLSTDQWVEAAVSMGANYIVLVTQHCSGFSMFPVNEAVYKETGFNYTYSVEFTKWGDGKRDVVREFVESCKKYNVLPAFYYSLNENYYLNVGRGKVQNTTLIPGQIKVTQELYEKIAVAQQRVLWSKYGDLFELWFDGGEWEILNQLATQLQPHAVYFNGETPQNNVRWIGSESGLPSYPVWSTNNEFANPGNGYSNGTLWNPAETDTTPTVDDNWFWHPTNKRRTLEDLVNVYHQSVGQNSNMLMNIAPDNTGRVPDGDMRLYAQIGAYVKLCYSSPITRTSGNGYKLSLLLPENTQFNRVILQEHQFFGQRVRLFEISTGKESMVIANGTSIGHKFILRIPQPVQTTDVTLTIIESEGGEPQIRNFAIYYCDQPY